MSTAPRYVPNYTIADYQQWDGDWELWSGIPISMSPSPFGRHGQLATRVGALLTNAIDSIECNATVLLGIDWIVSDDTVVRPDVSVVCGGPPERHIEQAPALIVEVISEGTCDRDEIWKKELYEREGVDWYLLVDSDSMRCFRLNSTCEYLEVNIESIMSIKI